MAYDKERFIDNVYTLASKQKIKIGEMESRCGVSIGYFARLRMGKKDTAPGADFLLRLADLLSVSVDSLLTFDFKAGTDSELLFLNYLEKLIEKTRNSSMIWREDDAVSSDSVLTRLPGTPVHPLYSTVPLENGKESSPFYDSPFHPFSMDIVPLIAYGSVFPEEDRTLYLVRVTERTENAAPDLCPWTELELVMAGYDLKSPIPLCHTDHERPGRFDSLMQQLSDVVAKSVNLPRFTPEAIDVMHTFLKEDNE